MKTIVNNISFVKANLIGLLHDTKKNKLMEVSYKKTLIGLDGTVKHIFEHNGKEVVVSEDNSVFKMFACREHFESQLKPQTGGCFLDAARTDGHYRIFCNDTRDEATLVAVTFINGVPTEVDAPVKGFEVDMHCGFLTIKPIYEEGIDIDEYFDKVENAIIFHDYKVIDKEGNEKTIEGKCSFLLPTAEQQPVVDELRAVIEKMKEVGLGLMFDKAYANLHVYNEKETIIDYDREAGASICDINLPDSISLPNCIYDYCGDDGDFTIHKRGFQPEQ